MESCAQRSSHRSLFFKKVCPSVGPDTRGVPFQPSWPRPRSPKTSNPPPRPRLIAATTAQFVDQRQKHSKLVQSDEPSVWLASMKNDRIRSRTTIHIGILPRSAHRETDRADHLRLQQVSASLRHTLDLRYSGPFDREKWNRPSGNVRSHYHRRGHSRTIHCLSPRARQPRQRSCSGAQ